MLNISCKSRRVIKDGWLLCYSIKSSISDIKIGQKSGNTFLDYLRYAGNSKRYFTVYLNCFTQTKVSDKVLGLC